MVLMRNDVLYIKKPGSILQFKIIFLQNKQHYNLFENSGTQSQPQFYLRH